MIYLDFDGVLFDSAREAFSVGHATSFGDTPAPPEVEESRWRLFRDLRHVVSAAWHYRAVFDAIAAGALLEDARRDLETAIGAGPGPEDKAFETAFFACRARIIAGDRQAWMRLSPPYRFFQELLPFLEDSPDSFTILSTRNEESIREILAARLSGRIPPILGARVFSAHGGSKAAVIRSLPCDGGPLLFIDDNADHLREARAIPGLRTVQAKWGYVDPADSDDNTDEAIEAVRDCLVASNVSSRDG